MKLLFVDEFKYERKEQKLYGLAAVLIDNSSYMRFKKEFYSRLTKLGWNPKIEIKGRYSFSSKKGDAAVSVENRLKFVESLFELSESGSSKYASAKVYYAIDLFSKSTTEVDMYISLLERILNKFPKGSASGNKNGKNNFVIFLDSNQALDINIISEQSEKVLSERNLYLVERCIDFCSGNETPGIIFADHVAYFVNNYLKTNSFNQENKKRIELLISKLSEDKLSTQEQKELSGFLTSFKKEQKSVKLLSALKKMIYVK